MNPTQNFSRIESVIGPVQYAEAFYHAVSRAELRSHPVPSIQRMRRRLSETLRSSSQSRGKKY